MRINFKNLLCTGLLVAAPNALALNIFACEPEYASLAKELAPEAKIYSATTALQDPHNVQARPSLIAKMRRADIAVCAGAELEVGWLPMLQMKANNRKVQPGQPGMFFAADYVETLDKLEKVTRAMGDVHAGGNPHLQFSPQRMAEIASALAERLSQVDPANRASYTANLDDFSSRWQQATFKWEQQAQPLAGLKVVAYHTNYRYLFDWLGIEQVGDLEPKPGLPPTSGHLASLLRSVEQQPIAAVVLSGYQDPKGAKWLATRANVPKLTLPFGPGVDGIDDLFELYQDTIDALLTVAEKSSS